MIWGMSMETVDRKAARLGRRRSGTAITGAASRIVIAAFLLCLPIALAHAADKKDKQQDKTVKPMAGPRATMLRETPLVCLP